MSTETAARHPGSIFLKDATFWAELIASGGIGAALFWIFKLEDLGQVTWIVGGLLVFHRYALLHHFRQVTDPIDQRLDDHDATLQKIAGIIDLSEGCEIDLLRSAIDKYVQITEPELGWQKNEAVSGLVESLSHLQREKRSRTMYTAEYYSWLLKRIASTRRGDSIWAVSRMLDCEWDDTPEEKDFLLKNLEAAARGVNVQRIFLCKKNVWDEALKSLEPVKRQIAQGGSMEVYYGDVEAIEKRDAEILNVVGDGLIAFDRDVILIDEHSEDGTARGHVVLASGTIAKKRLAFERIRNMCTRQQLRLGE